MGALKALGFAAGVVAAFSAALLAAQAVQPLAFFLFSLWFLAFYLDAATTEKIYRLSPTTFERGETNRIFVALVQRAGMPLAFPLYFVAVEVPCFAFISLAVAPALGSFLFGGVSVEASLGAGAAVLAFAHAHAWRESAKTAGVLARRKGGSRC
jgi:hypothetical protein